MALPTSPAKQAAIKRAAMLHNIRQKRAAQAEIVRSVTHELMLAALALQDGNAPGVLFGATVTTLVQVALDVVATTGREDALHITERP